MKYNHVPRPAPTAEELVRAEAFAKAHGTEGFGVLRVLGFTGYTEYLPDEAPPVSGTGIDLGYAMAVDPDHLAVHWLTVLEGRLRKALARTKGGTSGWEPALADIAAVCTKYDLRWIKLYDIPPQWQASLVLVSRRKHNLDIRFGESRR
ncbi:MAG: hypothetical protein GC134_09125 [Proteobacteria bacterium]|nr:hypothetical protein [Pseudomonadota bacterium]